MGETRAHVHAAPTQPAERRVEGARGRLARPHLKRVCDLSLGSDRDTGTPSPLSSRTYINSPHWPLSSRFPNTPADFSATTALFPPGTRKL